MSTIVLRYVGLEIVILHLLAVGAAKELVERQHPGAFRDILRK